VCVAGDFNRYDEYAIGQMNRSIELVRYRSYDDRLLALELVASTSARATAAGETPAPAGAGGTSTTVCQYHEAAPAALKDLYDSVEQYLLNLGDDVTKIVNKAYYAFRRLKNFACIEIHPRTRRVVAYLKVDPSTVSLEQGFTRDVRGIGHFGTGELEVTMASGDDVTRAHPLFQASYEAS
jgi:predicted transport protein